MKRCDEFAAEVEDLILDSGYERDAVLADLQEACDLSAREVESILSGDTAPANEVIDGFACVLDTDASHLESLID